MPVCDATGRLECRDAEAGHKPGMFRDADCGAERLVREDVPLVDDRLNKAAPRLGVEAEFPVLCGKIPMKQYGAAVVERMRKWEVSVNPFKPVLGERERCEKWRSGGHGMNCGSKVVQEAGKCKWKRARAAAGDALCFEDLNSDSGSREGDGGGKAVGAGADDAGALHEFILPDFCVVRAAATFSREATFSRLPILSSSHLSCGRENEHRKALPHRIEGRRKVCCSCPWIVARQ